MVPVERVLSRSVSDAAENGMEITGKEQVERGKATVIGMLAAQSVVYLSIAFMLIGLFITGLKMWTGVDIMWRDIVSVYFERVQLGGKKST